MGLQREVHFVPAIESLELKKPEKRGLGSIYQLWRGLSFPAGNYEHLFDLFIAFLMLKLH